jgi:hypothetical protein
MADNFDLRKYLAENKLTSNSHLNEMDAKVITRQYGGSNDSEFLKIVWHMEIKDLQDLLDRSEKDLKWLKANSRGGAGMFRRKDALIVGDRVKWIKDIISQKEQNPDYIPDLYKK